MGTKLWAVDQVTLFSAAYDFRYEPDNGRVG